MWPLLCVACWSCWSAPDWPDHGEPDAKWVEAALEWRLRRGTSNCTARTEAIDALTLQWLSAAEQVVIRVETAEWPEVAASPGLLQSLVQVRGLQALQSPEGEHDDVEALRKLRRIARRSRGVWNRDLRAAFAQHRKRLRRPECSTASRQHEARTGAGEHQGKEGG